MATYFHGNNSEIHGGGGGGGNGGADGLQTLVLMNPGYIQYPDTPPPPHPAAGNLMFLNSAAGNTALNIQTFPHAPPHQSHHQQFVGIPLSAATEQQPMHAHHDVSALHSFAPRGQYSLWNTIDPNPAAREHPRTTQGLSLSLPVMSGDDLRGSGGSPSSASNAGNGGVSGIQSVLLSSKYLKAAQELLEEVVNVNNNNNNNIGALVKAEHGKRSTFDKVHVVGESSSGGAASGEGSGGGEGNGGNKGGGSSEISPNERQEIQMKKAKLITMLDEVEQRYRQYHRQMQVVISSFEQVAGMRSAKTYTALALQTISKQFRCLKDAITGQMRGLNKKLGEEEQQCGSRLKYVDHHLRQQRAIQQLGMMHHHNHNAWRPQRGLPERSVSVLRAWLFEHFLHPYPKDSDKHMLAKQTGLTRSQVSNWFINARVRLWKPMVEEMYLEEMKDHENNNIGSEDNNKSSNKSNEDDVKISTIPQEKVPNNNSENEAQEASKNFHNTPIASSINHQSSGFSFNIGSSSSELDGITQGNSPKKPKHHNIVPNNENLIKFGGDDDDHDNRNGTRDEYSFMGNQTNFIGGFGQYPIEEIGRFNAQNFTQRFSSGNSGSNNNNGVSLTLGLPHCDTLSGTHQTFLPNHHQLGRRLDMSAGTNDFGALNTPNPHHSSAAFENINNIQNPKRFVAQLLPDFVA